MLKGECVMDNLVSIIIPSYNEEDNIENTAKTILDIMDNASINCELIFVSDGSNDKTFEKILSLSKNEIRVKGIEFSRNFGKEAAIIAGLKKGNGACFVVMDCDLQHPPEVIVEMYRRWEEGFEIVEGIKLERGKESIIYKAFSNLFYKLISKFTGYPMKNTSDFKLIDKKVVDILINLPERKPFFRALSLWTGFKSVNVKYKVGVRNIGNSKWSVMGLIKYAISNIISFSTIPLDIITYIGVLFILGALALGVHTLVYYFMGKAQEGFATVILLILISGGAILISIGIIGKYIAAIYEEVKHRPRYLVRLDTDKNYDEQGF